MTNGLQERWGRETRLLVLIVVVSLAVLLGLARFRFPTATLDDAPPAPSPLANLASRAVFDELSDAMAATAGRIGPRVIAVRLEPQRAATARGGRGRQSGRGAAGDRQDGGRYVPGLRVRSDLALVRVPAGMAPATLADSTDPVEVVHADAKREIALVRVPSAIESALETGPETLAGFTYLAEVTATADGPTVQPMFIGRTGSHEHDPWPAALTSIDNAGAVDGAWLFTIEGRLIGLVVRDDDGAAVVPPAMLESAVTELLSASGAAS